MIYHDEQLGRCQFWMDYNKSISVQIDDNHVIAISKATVCTSYSSVVAVHNPKSNDVFLLPRWDYSPTTTRQVTRWLRTIGYIVSPNDIRKNKVQGIILAELYSYNGTKWWWY